MRIGEDRAEEPALRAHAHSLWKGARGAQAAWKGTPTAGRHGWAVGRRAHSRPLWQAPPHLCTVAGGPPAVSWATCEKSEVVGRAAAGAGVASWSPAGLTSVHAVSCWAAGSSPTRPAAPPASMHAALRLAAGSSLPLARRRARFGRPLTTRHPCPSWNTSRRGMTSFGRPSRRCQSCV